jgi:hypothetical protein
MVEHIHLHLYKLFRLQNVFISTVCSVDFDGSCGLQRGMIHGTYKKIFQADSSVLLSSGNVEPVSRFVVINILHDGIEYILGHLRRIRLGGNLW